MGRYRHRPLHLFGGVGLLMGAIGFVFLLYLTVLWFWGHGIGQRPLLTLGVLLVVVGIQLVSLGLLSELDHLAARGTHGRAPANRAAGRGGPPLKRRQRGVPPVNILALTSAYPKFDGDSTAPFIASITEHVAALGHTVHVVLPEHAEWARPPVEGNIHFHPYRYSPSRSWTPWGYAQSLEGGVKLKRRLYALAPTVYLSARHACRRLTAAEHFDVVHAHWVVPNGVIAAGVSDRRGIPLVVTLHGSDISVAEQKPWLGRARAARVRRAPASITAPSDDLLERAARLGATGDLRAACRTARTRSVFRPDPEDARRVRGKHGFAEDDVLVLGVGRFVALEGIRRPHHERGASARAGADAEARPRRRR